MDSDKKLLGVWEILHHREDVPPFIFRATRVRHDGLSVFHHVLIVRLEVRESDNRAVLRTCLENGHVFELADKRRVGHKLHFHSFGLRVYQNDSFHWGKVEAFTDKGLGLLVFINQFAQKFG
jgi:hypothetical protein